MKDKTIIIIIGFMVVIGFVYAYDIGEIKERVSKLKIVSKLNLPDEYPKVSINDISSNPESYYDKNISIKGVLIEKMTHYGLQDNDGRWIVIGQDYNGAGCLENYRSYNIGSGTYTAKGTFKKAISCSYLAFDLNCYNRIICDETIS